MAGPEKIIIDKGGAHMSAIKSIQTDSGVDIELCQIEYFDDIVE